MSDHAPTPPNEAESRRSLMSRVTGAAMIGGLAAGYGMFAHICGRFLYPSRDQARGFVYVGEARALEPGRSFVYRTPGGASIAVARSGPGLTSADFIALSSVCPHLGCQVHWEGPKDRFFCPCHNGTFDRHGKATGGPPKDAGQELERYPLEVRNGLIFIEIPQDEQARAGDGTVEEPGGPPGPGHDPCLFQRPREV